MAKRNMTATQLKLVAKLKSKREQWLAIDELCGFDTAQLTLVKHKDDFMLRTTILINISKRGKLTIISAQRCGVDTKADKGVLARSFIYDIFGVCSPQRVHVEINY